MKFENAETAGKSIQPNGAWLAALSTWTETEPIECVIWVTASLAMIWMVWGPSGSSPRERNAVTKPGFAVGLLANVGKISITSGRGRPVWA